MRNAAAIISRPALLACCLLIGPASFAAPGQGADRHAYEQIQKLAAKKDRAGAEKSSRRFLSEYPRSAYVPDVRLICAEIEDSPDRAIAKYRIVANKYRYYTRRDFALLRICEIEFIQSRWKDLYKDARAGIGLKSRKFSYRFGFYRVTASIHLNDFENAEKECRRLVRENHDYRNLARSLLVLAYVIRSTTGMSRDYIAAIREIALGFGDTDSDVMPATLYYLGDFYASRQMYDESFSALSDLIDKYPGSPEATEAVKRLSSIGKHDPKRVFYLPGREIIDNAESIDIKPERDIPEASDPSSFYSLSIGPLPSTRMAEELRHTLAGFSSIKTVRLKSGYILYIGRYPDEESALKNRVRLAEEYGINGRIVRVAGGGDRTYIYGD